MTLLEIDRLRVAIVQNVIQTPVIRDVSLSLDKAEICGLVGESGAGKSMIAKTILGLLPSSARILSGTVKFSGDDLLQLNTAERQRLLGKDIALIPQDPMVSLNPVKPVGAQMDDGVRLHLGLSKPAARQQSLGLLEEVLIREPKKVYESYSHELSGGMRQRILIAMAFSCEPKLIIADEPTTALDVTVQKRVLGLIRKLQQKQNTSLLFVTHDLGVVAKICDRVVVLYDGRVLENTVAETLFNQPAHPYTSALLDAMPRFDQPQKLMRQVPPSLIEQLARETAEWDHHANG